MVLHPTLRSRAPSLAQRFEAARPFRHVVIDDFFAPAFAERLACAFPAFDAAHALNERGEVGGKAVRQDVRNLGPDFVALDDEIRDAEFLNLMSLVSGIPELRYDPAYVGGGTHENRDGQGLAPHVDFNYHPLTRRHRRLNLIVYLNDRWDPDWGGCIELHKDPWSRENDEIKRIVPRMNRAVLFETTETSWHGFQTIRLPPDEDTSRKSFALYLYTDERPVEQTAPEHATVYVPLRTPDFVRPGHALTPAQVRELEALVAGGLGQLRYLYEREKQFTARIQALEADLRRVSAHVALPLSGYARQVGAGRGYWPDGWAGPELAVILEADRDLSGLLLALFVPAEQDQPLRVTVSLEEERRSFELAAGTGHELRLEARLAAGKRATLRLESSRSWRPAEAGGEDHRELALRVDRITCIERRARSSLIQRLLSQ